MDSRKRRRYDSDEDDDDVLRDEPSRDDHLASSSLVDGITVDKEMLQALGMDDLISSSSDDDDRDNAAGSNNDIFPGDAEVSRAPEETLTLSSSGSAGASAAVTRVLVPPRVHAAVINVGAHVRHHPVGEGRSSSACLSSSGDDLSVVGKLVRHVATLQEGLLKSQHEYSANQLMGCYRADRDTRRARLAVGATAGPGLTPAAGGDGLLDGDAASPAPAKWENRFGVKAGWRWDGVIRGTGVEEKVFGCGGAK